MPDWFRYIDSYCERVAPGFWDEPLNAVSNVTFLFAAAFAYSYAKKHKEIPSDGPIWWLTAVASMIGFGSFLFHTYAQYWALLADVIPIAIFMLFYLGFALTRYCGYSLPVAVSMVAVFGLISGVVATTVPETLLYGSVVYFPSAAMLYILWGVLKHKKHVASGAMLLSALIFSVALVVRTADIPMCDQWPLGTHFVWHILNGTLLYILLRAEADYSWRSVVGTAKVPQPATL